MIASEDLVIDFIFFTASGFSILAIILISDFLLFKIFLNSKISFDVLTNDNATQSTSCLIKKFKSSLSFLVRDLNVSSVLGKLIPFLELNVPPFKILQTIDLSLTVLTLSLILPSSIKTRSSILRSFISLE